MDDFSLSWKRKRRVKGEGGWRKELGRKEKEGRRESGREKGRGRKEGRED